MRKFHLNKNLLLIFTVALCIRILFSLVYWVDKPITHDAEEYLLLADNLVAGKGYGYEVEPGEKTEHHERAPVYPLFLASIFFLFGKNLIIVKIIQSIISAFFPLIMFSITEKIFKRKAAVTAAWITAFYPPLFWGAAEFLSETLFTTIAMLGFLYLLRFEKDKKIVTLFISVLWFIIAAHTKPVMLMGLPLIALWLWLRRFEKRMEGFKHAVLFSLAVIVLLMPWTVRNYIVEERFILIASEGGITFWTGNHPLAVGDGDMAANPQLKLANNELRKEYGYPPPAEMEEIYYRETFDFIKKHPFQFLWLLVKKGFYFWFPVGRSMALFSLKHQLVSHISYFPILLLAILATVNLIRRKKLHFIPYISMLAGMISCVLFFPQERYRIPLVDPFLIVLAGYYIAEKYPKLREKFIRKK